MTRSAAPDRFDLFLQRSSQLTGKGITPAVLHQVGLIAEQLELSYEELQAAAAHLGLSNSEIQSILAEFDLPRESSGGGAWKVLLALFLAVLFFGGGGIAIGFILIQQQNLPEQKQTQNSDKKIEENKEEPKKDDSETSKKDEEKKQEPAPTPTEIQDAQLSDAIAKAIALHASDAGKLAQLKSLTSGQRKEALAYLYQNLPSYWPNNPGDDPAKIIFSRLYVLDSEDAHSQWIREQLLKFLPPEISSIPDNEKQYQKAFWAVDALSMALEDPSLAIGRSVALRQTLDQRFSVVSEDSTKSWRTYYATALADHFYNAVVELAAKDTTKATQRLVELSVHCQHYVPASSVQSFRDRVVLALQGKPAPKKTETVKKEDMPKVEDDPKNTEKKTEPEEDPRVVQLRAVAEGLLNAKRPDDANTKELLQSSVRLAFVSTLAVALKQKNTDFFDKLAVNPPKLQDYLAKIKKEEIPDKKAKTPNEPKQNPQPGNGANFPQQPPPGPGGGIVGGGNNRPGGFGPGRNPGGFNPGGEFDPGGGFNPGGNGGMQPPNIPGGGNGQPAEPVKVESPFYPPKAIDLTPTEGVLAVVRQLQVGRTVGERLQAFGYLATNDKIESLPGPAAEMIANYLMAVRIPQEWQTIQTFLPKLTRFPELSLALSDALGERTTTIQRMEQILFALTNEKVALPRDSTWSAKSRVILMKQALTAGDRFWEADAVQQMLRDLYEQQAVLLRITVPTGAEKLSFLLEKMIQEKAGLLAKQAKDDAERNASRAILQELAALDYLSKNDLQATVMLQRLWARVLAEEVRRATGESLSSTLIVQEMDRQLSSESSVLWQLRVSESAILRLWLLQLGNQTVTAN